MEGVKVTIVHSAVGAINESDVTLAEASNAFIVGFNVRPTPQARQQAEADDVESVFTALFIRLSKKWKMP